MGSLEKLRETRPQVSHEMNYSAGRQFLIPVHIQRWSSSAFLTSVNEYCETVIKRYYTARISIPIISGVTSNSATPTPSPAENTNGPPPRRR